MLPDAKVFMGEQATEAVLRTHGRASRIVHIATHGYFRQDNPMFSSIRLGDSHLSLYDINHLQLPAELVVLSGCATGLNVITPGDELIGLVRGLLQAGAQSLVLSLWDVHDESTKDFMIAFYTRLQQGQSKAEAMQAAMIELREKPPPSLPLGSFLIDRKGVSVQQIYFRSSYIFRPRPFPYSTDQTDSQGKAKFRWSIFRGSLG